MKIRTIMGCLLLAGALGVSSAACSFAAEASSGPLSSRDAATADGSVRAGLHNGKIFAVLTAAGPNVVLSPDSWSGDEEAASWTRWLSDLDNSIFSQWEKSQPGDGQQTVEVRITKSKTDYQAGTYFAATSNKDAPAQNFFNAIKSTVQRALDSAPAMPVTKNPLKEIHYTATFMCDGQRVPLVGREQLGFMAVLTRNGDNINVYGRMKDGQAPGIQILSDNGGGNIEVTDVEPFLQRCRESQPAASIPDSKSR